MTTAKSRIVSRAEPNKRKCDVCRTDSKGCCATDDNLNFCRGEPSPATDWKEVTKQPDANGFRHYRRKIEDKPQSPRPAGPVKPVDWAKAQDRRVAELAASPHYLDQLGDDLKLPAEALAPFGLGLRRVPNGGEEFSVPERDGAGAIIGLATRLYPGGGAPAEKKCVKGSTRGLTIPAGWRDRPGPLLVVEGFSDAAALTAAGLCAVGRPSNCGGVGHLAALLTDWPPDRGIILIVENDAKADGSWPGRTGAEATARTLAGLLRRVVLIAAVPGEMKDVRSWLTDAARGDTPWAARGAELAELLAAALEVIEPAAPGGPAGDRVQIVISTEEHHVNDQAAEALGRDPDIFHRGGMLVRVLREEDHGGADAVVRRPAGTPVIRELARPILRERLTRCIAWKGWRGSGDNAELEPRHPPDWCTLAVQARGVWPAVRYLEAVVEHPVALPDGSLLTASGYHAPSRLLACLPAGLTIDVPDRPTQADAVAAAEVLLDAVCDFPFQTPAHRAGLIAGLLTPLAWFAFDGVAPFFLIDKNVRGAGAGLLADVISLVVTGREFSVMVYTDDCDEMRKRVTTLAVEGTRMVLLDNLTGTIRNAALDAALTATSWGDRVLGSTKGFDGPLHVTWFGTGNNVQFGGDLSRRTCHIRLDSTEECPELRTGFKYPDLLGHVRRNRGALLAAALTILRAHAVAGSPRHGLVPWGRFQGWSDVVREAVVFAGLPDCGETRADFRLAADGDAAAMSEVLDGLERMAANCRGVTTAEIVARLQDCQGEDWKLAMRAAVEELCRKLETRSLGLKLRTFKRRNFGGRMLDSVLGRGGVCRWEVVKADAPTGDASDVDRKLNEQSFGWDGGYGGSVPAGLGVQNTTSTPEESADGANDTVSETLPVPPVRTRKRSSPDDRPAAARRGGAA